MWHAYIGAMLTKAALPIIGAAVALIAMLSVALWWTTGRLSDARDALAASRADTIEAVRANQSNIATIAELTQAAMRNKAQRDEAIRNQRAALARITELENALNEGTTETIREVVVAADGDACAHARIPDAIRVRLTASGDRDQDDYSDRRADRSR